MSTDPYVDPKSPNRYIVATKEFLMDRFGGRPNETLRLHYTGESAGTPKRYWFEDTPDVRLALGMEPK